MALGDCAEDPAGATMYVSLEPCCHHGPHAALHRRDRRGRHRARRDRLRRPDAEGRRPRPGHPARRGRRRRASSTARSREAARLLNQPFRKHARTGRPLVVFKSAMTLDGKVATAAATPSGSRARRAARARTAGAPSPTPSPSGIGTALADDPRLTARVEGVARQPRRVVFDSEARLPLDSQLVTSVAEVPLTVVCSRAAKRTAVQALETAGVDVIVATGENEARARRATRSTSSASATSSRCCSRAARTSPAPSSRRARSTRRACSSRRCCSAAAKAQDGGRGRGRRGDRRGAARRRPSRPSGSTTTS